MRTWTTVAVLGLALAACGGPDSGGALEPPLDGSPSPGEPTQVRVTLSEWSVAVDPVAAPEGLVNLTIVNDGTQDHEVVVLETGLAPDALPTTEGAVVDVEAEGVSVRSEVEPFSPGSRSLGLTMDAAAYVLICNVPGHYQQGMRAAFTVT